MLARQLELTMVTQGFILAAIILKNPLILDPGLGLTLLGVAPSSPKCEIVPN